MVNGHLMVSTWQNYLGKMLTKIFRKWSPDCHISTFSVWLHAAGLLRNLDNILHRLLETLWIPLHYLALVLCTYLPQLLVTLGYRKSTTYSIITN